MKTIIALFLTIAIVIFSGCTPQKKLRRLLKKYPELVTTTIVNDTFIVQELKHDTIAILSKGVSDTFVIVNDRFTTKIIRSHDTLKVNTYLPGDTVIHEVVKMEVKNVLSPHPWYKCYGFGIALFFICALVMETILYLVGKRKSSS